MIEVLSSVCVCFVCGGDFQQECNQAFSAVSSWMPFFLCPTSLFHCCLPWPHHTLTPHVLRSILQLLTLSLRKYHTSLRLCSLSSSSSGSPQVTYVPSTHRGPFVPFLSLRTVEKPNKETAQTNKHHTKQTQKPHTRAKPGKKSRQYPSETVKHPGYNNMQRRQVETKAPVQIDRKDQKSRKRKAFNTFIRSRKRIKWIRKRRSEGLYLHHSREHERMPQEQKNCGFWDRGDGKKWKFPMQEDPRKHPKLQSPQRSERLWRDANSSNQFGDFLSVSC